MKNKRLWLDYTKLRSALDFGTVLSHYQVDHASGRNQIKVLCPFHREDTPSLSINLSEGKWQCFGCGAKGNTLEFVTRREGHDPQTKDGLYAGALAALAIMGVSPESFAKQPFAAKASPSPTTTGKVQKRPESHPAPQTPPSGHSVTSGEAPTARRNPVLALHLTLDPEHPFLATRGLSPEIAREFGLGYCARGLMKNRIAIPIHNEAGELVAYAGRYAEEELPEDVERYRLPKGFEKSLVLYNLDRARQFKKRHLVLVEGYWSVFRLHRAGIPAAALMGTTCSPEQAALIKPAGFHFVTVLLDGDEAGRQSAPGVLAEVGRHVYVRTLELPEGTKPDTMPESWFEHLR